MLTTNLQQGPLHCSRSCDHTTSCPGALALAELANSKPRDQTRGTTQHQTTSRLPRGQPLTEYGLQKPSHAPTFTYDVARSARLHLLMLTLRIIKVQMNPNDPN